MTYPPPHGQQPYGQPYQPPVVSGPPQQYGPPQTHPAQAYGAPPPGYGTQPLPSRKWGSGKIVTAVVAGTSGVVLMCAVLGVLADTGDSRPKIAAAATTPPVATPTAKTPPTAAGGQAGTPAPLSPPDKVADIKMPDVIGQNAAVAEDYLKKLGFTNVDFGSSDHDGWVVLPENWTVKKQSTKSGKKVPADTLIVLTCTKAG